MTYSKAYSMGRIAYQERVDWKHNPFASGPDRADWKRGYDEAILDELGDDEGGKTWIWRQAASLVKILKSRG
jgi:hypothetical protein